MIVLNLLPSFSGEYSLLHSKLYGLVLRFHLIHNSMIASDKYDNSNANGTFAVKKNQKPNPHYTRGVAPKRGTSGRVHLHRLAPG